jgi:protein SCO1/2
VFSDVNRYRAGSKPAVSRRTRAGLVCLLATALLLAACSGSAGAPPEPSASVGQSLDHPLPARVLTQPLVGADGTPRQLESFAGKILVISDAMTLCQETCPLDTTTVVQAARAVDKAGLADKVEFVSITVDPARDTPQRMAAYRKLFAPAPKNWVTLTGTSSAISTLWDAMGVYRQKVAEGRPPAKDWLTGKALTYDIDHSDEVFFVDANSAERFLLEGPPHVSRNSAIPATLYHFMDADGHRNVTDPAASAWTLQQALEVLSWLTGTRIKS